MKSKLMCLLMALLIVCSSFLMSFTFFDEDGDDPVPISDDNLGPLGYPLNAGSPWVAFELNACWIDEYLCDNYAAYPVSDGYPSHIDWNGLSLDYTGSMGRYKYTYKDSDYFMDLSFWDNFDYYTIWISPPTDVASYFITYNSSGAQIYISGFEGYSGGYDVPAIYYDGSTIAMLMLGMNTDNVIQVFTKGTSYSIHASAASEYLYELVSRGLYNPINTMFFSVKSGLTLDLSNVYIIGSTSSTFFTRSYYTSVSTRTSGFTIPYIQFGDLGGTVSGAIPSWKPSTYVEPSFFVGTGNVGEMFYPLYLRENGNDIYPTYDSPLNSNNIYFQLQYFSTTSTDLTKPNSLFNAISWGVEYFENRSDVLSAFPDVYYFHDRNINTWSWNTLGSSSNVVVISTTTIPAGSMVFYLVQRNTGYKIPIILHDGEDVLIATEFSVTSPNGLNSLKWGDYNYFVNDSVGYALFYMNSYGSGQIEYYTDLKSGKTNSLIVDLLTTPFDILDSIHIFTFNNLAGELQIVSVLDVFQAMCFVLIFGVLLKIFAGG